jgi:hypothetical protein
MLRRHGRLTDVPKGQEPAPEDLALDYDPDLRADIGRCVGDLAPGEWGELVICPGPYGCAAEHEFGRPRDAEAVEVCSTCRIIHLYRTG